MASGHRCLVTGAGGFIGRHLVRRLVAEGRAVTCVLRSADPPAPAPLGLTGAECAWFDGSTHQMMEIVARSNPDVVFHLAALFVSVHEPDDVARLVTSNVLMTAQLAEALARVAAAKPLLINTGTSWQHYRDNAYDPANLYAATKQAAQDVLAYYAAADGLRTVTLKLFDTYGPDDQREKLFTVLRRASMAGREIEMSAGDQVLDLAYVDDVVEAFLVAERLLLAGGAGAGESFAVSAGRLLSLREVVRVYQTVSGRAVNVAWGKRPYRPREVMVPWSTGTVLPGWRPRVTLEEGIRMMEESA